MIYSDLREDIINCKIIPGTKITEEDLVNKFHMSRTPIREVISKLCKDGLLEVKPKRGTFVTKIDVDAIFDAMFIRIAVEEKIYSSICGKLSEDQIKIIENILNDQKKIIEMEPSIDKSRLFYENDNEFHKTLFEFAGKTSTWNYLYDSQTPLNRARIMANMRKNESVKEIYYAHLNIFKYLKENNLKDSTEVNEKHLISGFDGMESVMEEYPDYFKQGDNND